jgi:Flp pilus assembly protein TadG
VKRNIIALILLIVVVIVAAGIYMAMQPPVNNTTNITNGTINHTQNQTRHNDTTNITAVKAKELAEQYIGMGVYLGNATLTTYKGFKVWNVTVYTTQGKYTDSIYINANTGGRVT